MLGDERLKTAKAENLAFRVVGLYQPVAVEEGAVAGIEHRFLLLVGYSGHKPQRHTPGSQFLRFATTLQVGQVMTGVDVAQTTPLGVEDSLEAGDEHVGGMSVTSESLTFHNTSPGELGTRATALSMLRALAITRAAGTPLLVAAPTTMPKRPSGSSKKS